jgi:hypothetical protein
MTWHPTTNLIQTELLTSEQLAALKAWQHGVEFYLKGEWIECNPNWLSNYVYRGKPEVVVKSEWFNCYKGMIALPYESRLDADLNADPERINVIRIDTCNGVSTAYLEGLKDE